MRNKGRTLIFAPHMDDESLSAGGLIQQRIAHGWEVRVVALSGRVYDYGAVSEESTIVAEQMDFMKACRILGATVAGSFNLCEGEPAKLGYYTALRKTSW